MVIYAKSRGFITQNPEKSSSLLLDMIIISLHETNQAVMDNLPHYLTWRKETFQGVGACAPTLLFVMALYRLLWLN
jgi:predicted TIM-barrel enzyme